MKPKRHRVTVSPGCKLVPTRDAMHPQVSDEALQGWAHEPLASVCCVVLDDGREVLIARKDIELDAPDTERSASSAHPHESTAAQAGGDSSP